MTAESELKRDVLLALGARSDCRVWRQNSGLLLSPATGIPVRAGILGCADLSGIVLGGRRLELELKAERGTPSEFQLQFGAMITRYGGLWCVIRSVEDAIAAVEGVLKC